MKKTLKNTTVTPVTPEVVTPEVVTKESIKPSINQILLIPVVIKLLRWIINLIIKLITLLSSKSTTFASIVDPIIKQFGYLLYIAEYFKLFHFFHYFRLLIKFIAGFNILLSILVLFSFSFSDYVFTECISDLYKLRLEYPKSDPMNYVAKIIMNSLYGRFGMEDNFVSSHIMNSEEYLPFETKNKENIHDVIDLEDNFIVQTTKSSNDYSIANINVAVASAITAYSRIHMSQFKNNDSYSLFYSDTDSIYVNKELPSKFISNTELGKLKLECICAKGVFIAPKVYGLLNQDGSETIKIKGLSKT